MAAVPMSELPRLCAALSSGYRCGSSWAVTATKRKMTNKGGKFKNMAKNLEQKVLYCAVEQWYKSHAGITSIDIARRIRSSNVKVMDAMIALEAAGKCSLNKNAEFFTVSIGEAGIKFARKATIAHVIFPNKEILTDHFYSSDMARQALPVYVERLHKGAHQYAMVYFSEEVLAKYLDRPELYDVEDSLSGGSIRSNTDDETTQIYMRHGRHQLANGRSAVLVPYKDLANLDDAQQRYWHGFEISNPEVAVPDQNYSKFIQRTFEGAFVDYENPLENVIEAVKYVNGNLGGLALFRHTNNPHLRIPVENTEKTFYDACSELFKIIGADSLVGSTIKKILVDDFGTTEAEFTHKKSGRALSPFQQLQLLETKAGIDPMATTFIDEVKNFRVRADHAIVEPLSLATNFVEKFYTLCNDIAHALMFFATKLEAARAKGKS